ncbi:UBX domain-containing protein 8 [Osmerus eperlanus]|uniref:UBX domain-containing protein 8 n=1 Tax=Osmerus eperlanus TaxID=29151 RepID=UPI002E14B6D3
MYLSESFWLVGAVSLSLFCCVSWKHSIIGVRGTLILVGRCFLLLGLSCLVVSYLYPRLRSAISSETPLSQYHEDDEAKRRQKLVREEQQNNLRDKAHSYQETVMRPRMESSSRKREDRFYRMTGETWKRTEGERLGEGESPELSAQVDINATPNEEAVKKRKLPESATTVHSKRGPPPEKKVVVLPEEPADDAEEVVRVALRCPSGRTVHRRFLKSHSSSILLVWLQKIGYHPTIYTLCTCYPRQPLITGKNVSMEDAGILTHTVLNVEEKYPSTT